MADRDQFQKKLGELLAVAASQNNKMTSQEVQAFFQDDNLTDEQMNLVHEFLMSQKVEVIGYTGTIENTEKTEQEEKDTLKVREELLKLSGVGPKVADCILLFSELKRFDVFPIDVWVRRVMNDLYIKEENEEKVSKKKIENLAKEKFGNLSGIAQQYLFYWRREA